MKENDPVCLWPYLKFSWISALDYLVLQYEAEWLRQVAARLLATDNAGQFRASCAALGPLQWAVGKCLRHLAATPAALKKMNRYVNRAPQRIRGLNMAVHYRARREIDGKNASSKSRGIVAEAWKTTDASVKDVCRRYRKKAAAELKNIVTLVMTRPHQSWEERQVYEALACDMCHRAQLTWLLPRKQKKKSRRRR